MTEAEWRSATDPNPMLVFLREKASDRKLRLFACASLRNVASVVTDEDVLSPVAVAEKYADGAATEAELSQSYADAGAKGCCAALPDAWASASDSARVACYAALEDAAARAIGGPADSTRPRQAPTAAGQAAASAEESHQLALLRDIFNPFHPVTFDPSWRTSTVLTLAQGIDTDRAYHRLPILADALQDAGCDDADLLTHCRGGGPHVRGCWVVDLVLGKE